MLGDGIVILVLAVMVFFAVRSMWRRRKAGGCSGCSGCSGCCHSSTCQTEKTNL